MSIGILHDMGAPPRLPLSRCFQGLGPYIGKGAILQLAATVRNLGFGVFDSISGECGRVLLK